MGDSVEEAIISLETRIAFQEKMIDELNHIIYKQQEQVDYLSVKMKEVHRKLSSMDRGENVIHASDEAPPPHY